MGLFSKDIRTLDDLFLNGLQTIYYAENQIADALPTMIEKAENPRLKRGFEQHLRETQEQASRLEEVFRMHGQEPEEANCPAIDGIIKASESLAGDIEDPDVLDAALAAGAQMVEHYEIARYGTLMAWAKQLGRDDCAQLLGATLPEEKKTDEELSAVAESQLNPAAERGSE